MRSRSIFCNSNLSILEIKITLNLVWRDDYILIAGWAKNNILNAGFVIVSCLIITILFSYFFMKL